MTFVFVASWALERLPAVARSGETSGARGHVISHWNWWSSSSRATLWENNRTNLASKIIATATLKNRIELLTYEIREVLNHWLKYLVLSIMRVFPMSFDFGVFTPFYPVVKMNSRLKCQIKHYQPLALFGIQCDSKQAKWTQRSVCIACLNFRCKWKCNCNQIHRR